MDLLLGPYYLIKVLLIRKHNLFSLSNLDLRHSKVLLTNPRQEFHHPQKSFLTPEVVFETTDQPSLKYFQTNSKRFLIFELISYKINHPINPHNNQAKLADKNDKNLIK